MPESYEKILERLNAGREYRQIQAGNIELRSDEAEEMIVEGYATTFGQPYVL